MEQFLIDTNVLSNYFSANLSSAAMRYLAKILDAVPNLSVITQIELLSWKTEKQIEQKIREFISDSLILDINQEVIETCVTLRRMTKIKTPDAIIAATAITHGLTLLTENDTDFKKIPGLTTINPYKPKS